MSFNIKFFLACVKQIPKVLEIVQTKFQQYKDAKKAQQIYVSENVELTTIYQGDILQEQQKQIVFKLMEQIYKEVLDFLKSYNFQKLYNTKMIKQYFYNEQLDYYPINLEAIAKDQFSIFTSELGTTNEVIWLNKALTKINYILILYFQEKFKEAKQDEEFLIYFTDILEFNQTNILTRAQECFSQVYNDMFAILKNNWENSILMNQQLENLEQEFKEDPNLMKYQKQITDTYNNIIKMYNSNSLDDIKIKYLSQEDLETRDKFRVSDLLLNEGHKIIRQTIKVKILNSLQNYKQRDYSNLMIKVQNILLNQVNEDKFVEGIGNQQINQNLQLIIFSMFWIQLGIHRTKIEILLKELEKCLQFQVITKEIQQIDLQQQNENTGSKFEIERCKKECKKAIEWYVQEVDEDINLLVICQLYMILSNFKFQNKKIYFGDYDSESRNILFKIIQYLNDLKFGYFNHEVVKICEILTHKIQIKLFEDIDQKIQQEETPGQILGELYKKRSEIIINNQTYHFLLQDTSVSILKSPSVIGKDFHFKHQLFQIILKSQGPKFKYYKTQQKQLLKLKLQQIQSNIIEKKNCNEYKFVNPLVEPKLFYFQTLSSEENNSNVVTLLISGFLSKNQDKSEQWKHLLKKFSGTVIALHWETKEISDFVKSIISLSLLDNKMQIINEGINNNQFVQANNEASIIGKYLAHFLDEGNLFGNRQINIICHSLGTGILLECVHELDRFSTKNFINDIVLFGGVADVYELQQRRWNSVSGSVHNMYSNNDMVLEYLFKFNYFFSSPCGLSPVKFGYKKIYNYDVSDIVNGHSGYWGKLDIILNICDFNSDYKVLVKNVQEII